MKPLGKAASVAGGYLTAFLIAVAAVAIHVALTNGPIQQASSGMYAFGDLLLFFGVFAVLALVPTAAALFFFRRYRHFWTVVVSVGLALAAAVGGALLFLFGVL
jgi:hypothetical protein